MEKKPEKGLFEFLKNIIIGIVTDVANSYYYFQQHIAPFFKEYFKYYSSDNIDLWLFLMFVILLFSLLIIVFQYFYYDILTNQQRENVLFVYKDTTKYSRRLFPFFKKKFLNLVKSLDNIEVANIIWWLNIIIIFLLSCTYLFQVYLFLINKYVYAIFFFFSLIVLLNRNTEK